MYSTITRKKCKCGCNRYPTLGYAGYSYSCAPQELKDKIGTKKQVSSRNKAKKNELSRKLHIEQNIVSGAELQRWFEDRRKEMTGKCDNCGCKTSKDNDIYWKFSIAHLLPKAYVKSVRTHPSNWLELCHFGNGCHAMMDNNMLDLTDMACWDKIVTRFVEMYPSIAIQERRRIPNILLQYVETEK